MTAKKTYQQKLDNINAYVEITNYHWDRLKGWLEDDEEFWEHIFGTMTNDDYWDWIDIEPALRIQHPDSFRRYPYVSVGTDHIKRCLMKGKPLYRKDVKGANFQTFRAWMNIKDVMNDINGNPTKEYSKQQQLEVQEDNDATPFERLFQFGE